MEQWSREWKRRELFELRNKWENCSRCGLCSERDKVVMGIGNPDADIMFIAEAPGSVENKEGEPLVGESGNLFTALMESVGINREDVFLDNIVACHPQNNRDPIKFEKDSCASRLHETIYIVDPLLIVTMGKVALNSLVGGKSWSIEKVHGELFSTPDPQIRSSTEKNGAEIPGRVFPIRGENKKPYTLDYDVVPIFHPAFILRRDSYNSKKNCFEPGGVAHQTIADLASIAERVERIKSRYESLDKLME